MDYDIILDNEWATVRYYPAENYLYHTLKQPVSGQPLREVMNTALGVLVQHGVTKWLSDDRLNAEMTAEDMQEAAKEFAPVAINAGWRYWALVVPDTLHGRESMIDFVETLYRLGVRVMVFTQVEPARLWLLQQ